MTLNFIRVILHPLGKMLKMNTSPLSKSECKNSIFVRITKRTELNV